MLTPMTTLGRPYARHVRLSAIRRTSPERRRRSTSIAPGNAGGSYESTTMNASLAP